MIEVRQTETFAAWFRNLRDRRARARIQVRIDRLSLGNPGDASPVGEGWRRQTHPGPRYWNRSEARPPPLGRRDDLNQNYPLED